MGMVGGNSQMSGGWVRTCGMASICAALPTAVWRVLVGFGLVLGTPSSWRHSEAIPGSGTLYVCVLSLVQLTAASCAVVLFVEGADRIPRWSPLAAGRRLPAALVVGAGAVGATALALLVILSAVYWGRVDPFRDRTDVSGWTVLCWACYAVAVAWPPLLAATTFGYWRNRTLRGDDSP